MPRPSASLLFLHDFDPPPPPPPEPEVQEPPPPPLTEADLAAAEARGYQRGREMAEVESNALVARALSVIGERLADAHTHAVAAAEATATAMMHLLLDTLGAGFPALRERYGEAEVLRFVQKTMATLMEDTVVRIRVHPAHVPAVKALMDTLPRVQRGNATVEDSDIVAFGDAKIVWQDGAALRIAAEGWEDARRVLESFGLALPGGSDTTQP